VNKREFGALGWRSNQGYTTMHGQATIKIYCVWLMVLKVIILRA